MPLLRLLAWVYGGIVVGEVLPFCWCNSVQTSNVHRVAFARCLTRGLALPLSSAGWLVVLCVCVLSTFIVCYSHRERELLRSGTYHTYTIHITYLNPCFYALLLLLCLERPPHPKNVNVAAVTLNYYVFSLSLSYPSWSSYTLCMVNKPVDKIFKHLI